MPYLKMVFLGPLYSFCFHEGVVLGVVFNAKLLEVTYSQNLTTWKGLHLLPFVVKRRSSLNTALVCGYK